MTLLRSRPQGERDSAVPALPPATPRTGPATWARDLVMGMRFAAGGGREGWIRTTLTAAGVALGVAVLLFCASAPHLMNAWHGREKARENLGQAHPPPPGDRTLLYAHTDTVFHGTAVRGRLVRPDGAHPPVPPGVHHLPGPGEMVVSPALKDLLADPGNALLRERLSSYRIVGVIGAEGLQGPRELTYLAHGDTLTEGTAGRIDHFGKSWEPRPLTTPGLVLVIMTCVALMTPVMVFIGTSVRFGNERRERRLAALRLVGADVRTTRRIASGEALFGSLLGLLGGGALFLAGRRLAPSISLWDINVYPSDVTPGPLAALLITVLVPTAAVLVTLVAQRGVTVEPLGVVRNRPPVRRRLWWRVALPVAGAALLVPMAIRPGPIDNPLATTRLAAGATLLLFGVTALLPWLVDRVVGRLRGGPVPWQLAVRRLQLSSGPATRAVSGITVALAGAVAIHMLMTGSQAGYAAAYAESGRVPQISFWGHTDGWRHTERALTALRNTPGVTSARGLVTADAGELPAPGRDPNYDYHAIIAVGSCAELRKVAELPSCRDGDAFVTDADRTAPSQTSVTPGATLDLNPAENYGGPSKAPRPWTVPPSARAAHLTAVEDGHPLFYDLLLTPSVLDASQLSRPDMQLLVRFDRGTPDAVEHVRNTAARIDPTMLEGSSLDNPHDRQYDGIRTTVFIGAVITLLLIGAGLIISTVEQLYERRRLLSTLDAYGTRRATLGWSVLWQTALPVALGLTLALACGLSLGSLLLTVIGSDVMVDWPVVAGMLGIGGGVILFVTALSLPPLWRMMRPDGLRTE
ncbi:MULTISPECIES: FtsX-like permease family protein [unclassified Streptomyces]|uniref:FtsX-like permease family protein n=1 Tax=unclassified Streptomyces TaxID=2593676 RepID=UPI0003646DB8|nr:MULTISPECIES: FtsX-like permease family protein [unclassified Streptomyces]MYT31811.1 ABC transporter permease [Streptomyces sp. SID8354]